MSDSLSTRIASLAQRADSLHEQGRDREARLVNAEMIRLHNLYVSTLSNHQIGA